MKKNWYYIIGGIITLALIIAAFGYFSQTAFLIDKNFGLKTDFTALVGTNVGIETMYNDCRAEQDTNKREVCYINKLIDNVYGYAVLDGPARLTTESKNSVVNAMKEMNSEVKRPNEYKQFTREQKKIWDKTFSKGIFSSTLIRKVSSNSYNYNGMKTITAELDKSLNIWCNGLSTVFLSGKFEQFYKLDRPSSEVDLWLQLCEKKPEKMFTATKTGIMFSAPDIDLYKYTRYETICEEPQPCKPDANGFVEYCPINVCRIVELPETKKELVGTIYFSKIDFAIKPLGNDFVMGLNDGVSQMSQFTKELDFAKYILQMPWDEGIDITKEDFMDRPGFAVFTTNEKVTKLIDDVQDIRGNR